MHQVTMCVEFFRCVDKHCSPDAFPHQHIIALVLVSNVHYRCYRYIDWQIKQSSIRNMGKSFSFDSKSLYRLLITSRDCGCHTVSFSCKSSLLETSSDTILFVFPLFFICARALIVDPFPCFCVEIH